MRNEIPQLPNGSTAPVRLLDQVRERLRFKHYSIRTENSYVGWIRRYILFHDKRHPRDMGATHVERFLTHLAVDRDLSASTQNAGSCGIANSCGRHRGARAAPALRYRYAPDGGGPSADQGRRFCPQRDPGSRRQEREGSGDDAAAVALGTAAEIRKPASGHTLRYGFATHLCAVSSSG